MQDRISNHPNRWVLTPVTGEADTYDFTRADDPVQAGTPLNKATFLPDAVAAAVEAATGVSGVSLPADALNALAAAVNAIGLMNNAKIAYGSYVGTGTNSTTAYLDIVFPIIPRIVLITPSNAQLIYPGSTSNGLVWMYDQSFTNISSGYGIEWVLSGKTLRRRVTRNNITAAQLANTSGTTYYYVGVGE